MARFILSLTLIAGFALVNVAPAMASGRSGGSHGASVSHSSNVGNKQFSHNSVSHGSSSHNYSSFRYRQSNWGARSWNSTYGCYCHWCPTTSCYVYWCAPYQCYYPVSYCPTGIYNYPGGQ